MHSIISSKESQDCVHSESSSYRQWCPYRQKAAVTAVTAVTTDAVHTAARESSISMLG